MRCLGRYLCIELDPRRIDNTVDVIDLTRLLDHALSDGKASYKVV
jgi:hypothetical protein